MACMSQVACEHHVNLCLMLQAYDAMLNEHHQMRSYGEADSDLDIASDPLVFLVCGHVIHMSTMDHYMSLDEVYSKDEEGRWAALSQLGVCTLKKATF